MTAHAELNELGVAQDVELSMGTVRVRQRGSGPPLVLIHGLLVNGLVWRKVVPALANRFRCITPDLPLGAHWLPLRSHADRSLFGLAALVTELLEVLNLEDVILVGNDSGGAICQAVVVRHPKRIDRLVLTSSDCYENYLPPIFRYLQVGARIPGFLWLAAQLLRIPAFQRLPITFGWLTKRPVDVSILSAYLRPTQSSREVRADTQKVIAQISSKHTLEIARGFGAFVRPVLLAWSKEDRVFPWRYAERLARDFPNARRVAIENAYSFVSEDQPERLVELIVEFALERLARSASENVEGTRSGSEAHERDQPVNHVLNRSMRS
jgi:pimeloyl-ACP methyl ester carboxylesterase